MKGGILVITFIGLSLLSVLYFFANFSYEILDNKIHIRWLLLRYIPFNSLKIDIDKIEAVRPYDVRNDILSGGRVWGNLLIKKGVIIQLKKGYFKKVYITPDNPKQFMETVRNRMKSIGN